MQETKFDCVAFIDGKRGLGKSTLAYQIMKRVNKYHKFNPEKDMLFTREEVLKALNSRSFSNILADELINVAFNRDFYVEDQKKLIKVLNMNRDHCNLFVGCIPNFAVLDTQLKDICKIRLTVIRRGIAILQTQNQSIYSKEKWDESINQKIEKEWVSKGTIAKPKYARLTTVRGLVRFKDISDKDREIYEKIKRDKRNKILMQEANLDEDKEGYELLMKQLKDGKITDDGLKQYCLLSNKNISSVKAMINKMLRDEGNEKRCSDYLISKRLVTKKKSSLFHS